MCVVSVCLWFVSVCVCVCVCLFAVCVCVCVVCVLSVWCELLVCGEYVRVLESLCVW